MTSPSTTAAPTATKLAAQAIDAVKVYGTGDAQVRALDGVSVRFPAGEFTAVMGPSGSGKSTLMHCMAGLDSLTEGTAMIGETVLDGLSDRELTRLRRDRVGFVFQAFNLLPTMTARENIELPVRLAGKAPDPDWFTAIVEAVGLGDRLHHRPAELSGGQQQRVAAARALITRPEIIFADEPTGALDTRTGAELLGFLRRSVKELGQTVVMVTHDAASASYADRVVFLADGEVVDELAAPTADGVLDRIKRLELGGRG